MNPENSDHSFYIIASKDQTTQDIMSRAASEIICKYPEEFRIQALDQDENGNTHFEPRNGESVTAGPETIVYHVTTAEYTNIFQEFQTKRKNLLHEATQKLQNNF